MNRYVIVPILLVLICGGAFAAEETVESEPSKYVSVTFEIKGLEESAKVIEEAVTKLATAVDNLAQSTEQLTPDQIEAFSGLVKETTILLSTYKETMKEIQPAIENAKDPIVAVLSELLILAQVNSVEPTIESINKVVINWLAFIGIIVLFVLVGLVWGVLSSLKQVKDMTTTLQSIAQDYEIVPRRLS